MIETWQDEKVIHLANQLKNGQGFHVELPGKSLLHIDRPLPFICVYRYPQGIEKTAHARLVDAQASFIHLRSEDEDLVRQFLEEATEILRKQFGAVLILEIWTVSDVDYSEPEKAEELFRLFCSHKGCKVTAETLQKELNSLEVVKRLPNQGVKMEEEDFPSYRQPLLKADEAEQAGVQYIGLAIEPFYYSQAQNRLYPMLFRAFRKEFSTALRKSFFDFVRVQTRFKVSHFQGLGRQKEGDLVWQIDRELVEINDSFDFLLLVTVTNHEEEWEKFQKSNFSTQPTFQYRLIPVDPEMLKRRLYNLPIEEVDDPTLAFLFRDKRDELDRQLNMLLERETPFFKYSSLQVFGEIGDALHRTACELLEKLPVEEEEGDEEVETIGAEEFAALAREEIEWLRQQYPALDATVELRNDIEGLMVSKGQLLVDRHFRTSRKRAEALIQHEVGTHVLTFYNGKAQPLQQLYAGAPGYEDLQEGLAVLAEYLTGGLNPGRLRILAARVVAVKHMLGGASFIDTFQLLHEKWNFSAESAFSLTTRVYRGGGLTKDAVYLKGLIELLRYLSSGGALEPLLIGKIRQDYLPFIDELMSRKILQPAPLKPRYLSSEESKRKLKKLKAGANVFNLVDPNF
ncbi:flavohemoglobin expression-modulating QEGLA motif protein [Nafulsella turpanensis]|uniref:flavohemoglobin expression-modulating QEGLA motif protein n=1 Tax=Nafulsella turpanensis TaxID=1265690 RepID=UPI00034ADC2F|nr:tyrosine/phenylalanine carboxypeptidase domain-containing protein [Nafulsella turpanensis]